MAIVSGNFCISLSPPSWLKQKKLNLMNSLFYLVSLLLCLTASAHAEANSSLATAVNLAGKQRMLSQKMSKEILLVSLDVERMHNLSNLAATSTQFNNALLGLMYGSKMLGLEATQDKKIMQQMQEIEEVWARFHELVVKTMSDKGVDRNLVLLVNQASDRLLEKLEYAVNLYEEQAKNVGVGSSGSIAKTINLAGRQRMLTQKMTKECLLIAYGSQPQENRDKLNKSQAQFEQVLVGLLETDMSLGLSIEPDANLKEQLVKVKYLWRDFKKTLSECVDTSTENSDSLLVKVSEQNLPLLRAMNKAVGMYEKLAH